MGALQTAWIFLKGDVDDVVRNFTDTPSSQPENINIPNDMRQRAAVGQCAKCGATCTSCNSQRREEGARWANPRLDRKWLKLWEDQARKDELTTPNENDEKLGV